MSDSFGKRLDNLITQFIKDKNRLIEMENDKIIKRNQENTRKFKSQIERELNTKPPLEKKNRKYTREQLMADMNERYIINLTRQKLSQYIRDEHLPSMEIILAFCDFFHVTYEYLCGESEIANPAAARVQDYIKLNNNAVNTLMNISDPDVITVLNALLSDRQSFEYAFHNMYEQAYQSYERKHSPNGHGAYDTSAIHNDIEYAISFSRFMEDNLMLFVKENFEKRLQEKIQYEEWRSSHFDEYEISKADIPEQLYPNTGTATVTVLPNK